MGKTFGFPFRRNLDFTGAYNVRFGKGALPVLESMLFGGPGLTAVLLSAAGATASGSSVTTASITATAGRKAYLALATNRASNTAPTLSVTGAGQTWTLVGSQVSINATYYYELFEADVTSGGSGALTISGTANADEVAWVIFDIAPAAGTTISLSAQDNSSVQTATSAPSDTVTAPGTGNYLLTFLAKGNDPNHSGLTATARAGWSTIGQHRRGARSSMCNCRQRAQPTRRPAPPCRRRARIS
jgi:hypothetical protein